MLILSSVALICFGFGFCSMIRRYSFCVVETYYSYATQCLLFER